ncbi:DEAD/DEAH box helicase [Deinococcus sp. SM5_A1]|uniref:DEAD/DEAH box helicase n=1 Tax=Deinococcus sp. SM5_A1 TaxID=3379094 RepID=UPI00385DA14C
MTLLTANQQVRHPKHGQGRVEFVKTQSAIVRFGEQLLEVLLSELELVTGAVEAIRSGLFSQANELLAKVQAYAIVSVNDTWGLFSRSRVALLPHQLWVCRQVISRWPSHWLIADDVGLGKTVEAGLVLWPLLSRKRVQRLLIICPAALVEQWQSRLNKMFDIRVHEYYPEGDTAKKEFWRTHPFVVASLQTLRDDRKGRHQRMLEADQWDLVVIDEAHHLYAPESGSTLGYQLVEKLRAAGKFRSLLLFSGTPHRGNDHAFLALLRLLDPEVFDPRKSLESQLQHLPNVLIRNNKQQVTDLLGKPLFTPPVVQNLTYTYSETEQAFYDLLTDFILTGQAYAGTLSAQTEQSVRLVLIAMQKLASSSVAAIHSALVRRLKVMDQQQRRLTEALQQFRTEEDDEADAISGLFNLMSDEPARLEELLVAAQAISSETKIVRILETLEHQFADRSVLFFTEYKATQTLLYEALTRLYGKKTVDFINGDNRLTVAGTIIDSDREDAAERFNAGEVRFLISTEAGGEGIDLQKSCHTLIHVDLPWNPMRLHQRVGRLNRYGQTRQVEVLMLRNPDTVEGRIWSLLNEKLERIRTALNSVMDDPEDLLQLVLGMSDPGIFNTIFDVGHVPRERLNEWFDAETSQIGGEDILTAVKNLVGHSARFDYADVSGRIPKLDLPDLEPFFRRMLSLNRRQVRKDEAGLSFKTPEAWAGIGVLPEYQSMTFNRSLQGKDAGGRILGVGHKLIDRALEQATALNGQACVLPHLKHPLLVYEVTDELTDQERLARRVVFGVELGHVVRILKDWELLAALNTQKGPHGPVPATVPTTATVDAALAQARLEAQAALTGLDLDFRLPRADLVAIFWPAEPSERLLNLPTQQQNAGQAPSPV